jgi:predicted dehydrogenase
LAVQKHRQNRRIGIVKDIAGRTYKYGVFGVGRIGKVHASIVQSQGHDIVAIGDDVQAAVETALDELDVAGVKTFNDPALMAQ